MNMHASGYCENGNGNGGKNKVKHKFRSVNKFDFLPFSQKTNIVGEEIPFLAAFMLVECGGV